MVRGDPVQCAICGWTGQEADLDSASGAAACPACGETVSAGQ